MMTRLSLQSIWLLLSLLIGVSSASPDQASTSATGLSILKYQTGWILVGSFDVKLGEWASLVHYRVLSRAVQNADRDVLRKDDVVELTPRSHYGVYIVNFEIDGENQRLVSPAGQIKHERNFTGVTLSPGTRLKVEEVSKDTPVGPLQLVWARVSPAAAPSLRPRTPDSQ